MPYNRLEHKGGAILTTLATDIGSGDTSLTLTASTNWPTGTNPFYLVIDPGLSNEEKILATARSTNSLTGLTRGVDGTTAATHTAGAEIKHIFTAVEADEANNAAKSTLGTVTTKGDLLVATAAQTLARQGVGANDTVLIADSGQTNGIKYGTITATSLTPTIAGNGLSISGAALLVNVDGTTLVITSDTLGVKALGIDTAQLAADSVTAAKIAADAVGTSEIAANAITASELANNAVDTAAINNRAITASKLATNLFGNGRATSTPTGPTGTMTVTHGCGFTPQLVTANVQSPLGPSTALFVVIDNLGATTFTAHIYNAATQAFYTAGPVELMYSCHES